MPKLRSDCADLAGLLGEAIQDDVECWEAFESSSAYAYLKVTKGGRDYWIEIRSVQAQVKTSSDELERRFG